jgi:hypothetical protein
LNQKSNHTLQRTNNQVDQDLQKELHQGLKKKEDVSDADQEEADRLKEKGNKEFMKEDYKGAIEIYN